MRLPGSMAYEEALIEALDEIGLGLRLGPGNGPTDQAGTYSLELPGGRGVDIEIKVASRPDLTQAQRLVTEASSSGSRGNPIRMLVADAIPDAVRSVLKEADWGYLDRRGHLRLTTSGVLIDTDVSATVTQGQAQKEPLGGMAGRSYAAAILLDPKNPPGIRQVARMIGMSASAVSDAARLLRHVSLVEQDGRPLIPDLFWALAEVWRPEFVPLAQPPDPHTLALSVLDEINLKHPDQPGWALAGTAAAVAWGAPVTARATTVLDFYVPNERALRRATLTLQSAQSWETRGCAVAVAPISLACVDRAERPDTVVGYWPLTRPLFVALDLAQDKARGAEILDDWSPGGDLRVW